MRYGHWLTLTLVLAASGILAGPAQAARPAPQAGTPQPTTQQIVIGTPLPSVGEVCQLGVLGPASFPMFYLYPPEDQYYVLIDPEACGCGGTSSVLPSMAHVALDFPEACSIPVRIGIVAADLSDPACPSPLLGQYLCAPFEVELTAGDPGEFDFAVPLVGSCEIAQKAFLMVTFMTAGDCGALPGLMIDTALCGCVAYNAWPDGGPVAYELCGTFPGSPVMYVDSVCGGVVSVGSQSWGEAKALYR